MKCTSCGTSFALHELRPHPPAGEKQDTAYCIACIWRDLQAMVEEQELTKQRVAKLQDTLIRYDRGDPAVPLTLVLAEVSKFYTVLSLNPAARAAIAALPLPGSVVPPTQPQ